MQIKAEGNETVSGKAKPCKGAVGGLGGGTSVVCGGIGRATVCVFVNQFGAALQPHGALQRAVRDRCCWEFRGFPALAEGGKSRQNHQ